MKVADLQSRGVLGVFSVSLSWRPTAEVRLCADTLSGPGFSQGPERARRQPRTLSPRVPQR